MNKWLILYRILSINVLLFTINVVDSANPRRKPTTGLSPTPKQTNVDSSQPTTTNTNSGNKPQQTPDNSFNTESSKPTTKDESRPTPSETTSEQPNLDSSQPTNSNSANTESSVTKAENETKKNDESDKVKFLAKGTSNDSTVEIDSNQYEIEHVKNESTKNVVVYRFKEGVKCIEFQYDNVVVWKHLEENDPYPNLFSINRDKPLSVLVNLTKHSYCQYFIKDNGWQLSTPQFKCYDPQGAGKQSKLSTVTVNVTKNNGNSDYVLKSEGNTRTFSAKDGKAFDTVKDGYCTKVWDTKDPNLYAKSVVYSGVGTQNLSLTINHSNNTYTKFTKENGKWKQHSTGSYESEKSTESESKESTGESDKENKPENSQPTVQAQSTGCLDKVKNCFSNMCCTCCRS